MLFCGYVGHGSRMIWHVFDIQDQIISCHKKLFSYCSETVNWYVPLRFIAVFLLYHQVRISNCVMADCSGAVLVTQPTLQYQHLILSVDCQNVRRKNWRYVKKKHSGRKPTIRRTSPSACMMLHPTPASQEAFPTQRWWWGDGDSWSWNGSCSRYELVMMDQTLVSILYACMCVAEY